ncbi:MAG: sulfotransferase [Planctomyces sp.]|nr:sulfotransferase [Planctomyces sp.]
MSEPTAAKHSSQGPFFLWHGLRVSKVLRLFALRPPVDASRWAKLALLPFTAVWNSGWSLLESAIYGRRIRETVVQQPPLFVLGFWRSGTTLLHNLVTSDPAATYANYYHCLCPEHFLLTERLVTPLTARFLPETRPMDNIQVRWDMPQEDEVALCAMSLASYYLQIVFHDDRAKYDRFLDMAECSAGERAAWKSSLDYLIRKLTFKNGKRVVLKSPSHTYKIPLLLDLYPEAKFIYIYRNPYAVFKSAVHLRRTMYEENGMCRPDFGDLDEVLLELYERAFRIYERDKALIPPDRLVEVRYEDFEQDPLGHLERIYEALGLPGFEGLREQVAPQVAQLRRYKKNRFASDPERMERVYTRLREAFDKYGYPSPMEESDVAA